MIEDSNSRTGEVASLSGCGFHSHDVGDSMVTYFYDLLFGVKLAPPRGQKFALATPN